MARAPYYVRSRRTSSRSSQDFGAGRGRRLAVSAGPGGLAFRIYGDHTMLAGSDGTLRAALEFVHRPPVDPAPGPQRLAPDEHVLRHGQVGEQRRLLVDDGDAGRPGRRRAVQRRFTELVAAQADALLDALEPAGAGELRRGFAA